MKRLDYRKWILVAGLMMVSCTASEKRNNADSPEISGTLENGYRMLEFNNEAGPTDYTVYRGDYIKFRGIEAGAIFRVPGLEIEQTFDNPDVFVKMTPAGVYPYTIGKISGTIRVVEFVQQRYHEVSSQQAAGMISKKNPVILDVRTTGEYMSAHIEDAILIPVQGLQKRINELEQYKNSPILVYCASGNRSTVASKLLIDAGFNDVSNLRYGINDWIKSRFPVVSGR